MTEQNIKGRFASGLMIKLIFKAWNAAGLHFYIHSILTFKRIKISTELKANRILLFLLSTAQPLIMVTLIDGHYVWMDFLFYVSSILNFTFTHLNVAL